MWNMPDFGRSDRTSSLNAKLHIGHDPNMEFKEQGNLFSATRFGDSSDKNTSVFDQLMNGVSDVFSNIIGNGNQININGTGSNIGKGADGNLSFLPGVNNNYFSASGGGNVVPESSSGAGAFPAGSDDAGRRGALPLEGGVSLGGAIALPTPSTSGNPVIPPNNGDTAVPPNNLPLVAPVVSGAPVANGNENTSVPLNIIVTTDPRAAGSTVIIISGVPAGATLSAGTNNNDGTWTLTPAQLLDLTLTPPLYDSGTYQLGVTAISNLNGVNATGTGQVNVNIEGVATAPTLSTGPASGNENSAIPLTITAGLVDNDGSETLSIIISGVPVGATLSAGINNGNGSWTLTPAQLAGLTITPPMNSDADFNLTVTAISSENGTTATISGVIPVTVNGTASVPTLTVLPANGNEDSAIPLTINASLNDNDGSEILSIVISGVPAGATLSAGINNGNGSWTLTPAQLAGLTLTPPLHSDADFNLTVTATSSENGTNAVISQILAVNVEGVATPPALAVNPASGNEDMPIPLVINASLVDNDGSETLSIIISGVPAGATLSAGINNGNGSWTLTPAQLAGLTFTPPSFASGEFTLTVAAVSAENGTTAQTSAVLSVQVSGLANEPILMTSPASGDENTAITLDIDAQLVVNDGSETLSIIISGVPAGATLSAGINNGDGSWTLTPAQLSGLTFTPSLYQSGIINLTVTAIANEGGHTASNIESLAVTVNGVATTPNVSASPASGNEDTAIPLIINASLVDNDGSETLSIVISGVPAGAVLSAGVNNGNGSWTLTPAQLSGLTITPPLHSDADFQLTVSAISSENGTTANADTTLNVTVNGMATNPVLSVSPATGNEDTPIALTISAALGDNDGSEILSIVISGVPAGATLSAGINNGDGSWTLTPAQLAGLTITPPLHSDADFQLTVTAISSENGTTAQISAPLNVVVNGVATNPNLSVVASSGNEDTAITLTINASLVDNDGSETLSVIISGMPAGSSLSAGINNGNGTWTLTPAQLSGLKFMPPLHASGNYILAVSAISSENGTTAHTDANLNVTVNGVATTPNLNVAGSAGAEDTAIPLHISASLADNDGSEVLSIIISGVPAGATLSAGINNGGGSWTLTPAQLSGLTITPPPGSDADFNLTVTATSSENGTTASTSQILHVDVQAAANTPILVVNAGIGAEDTAIALVITAGLTDLDGSETLSIVIGNVPAGAVLSAGVYIGGGKWSLSASELAGLSITPPQNFSGVLHLQISAIATETDGDTAILTLPCDVTVLPVADLPNLQVSAATGLEDQNIALNISSSLVDVDGSESLSIRISNVPLGATLSAGTNLGGGIWQLTQAQLAGLTIRPPANSNVDFDLTVTATATEFGGGSVFRTATLHVDVVGDADRLIATATTTAGLKNTAVNVIIGGTLADNDGSESLTFVITGIPDGFALNQGYNNGDNSWTLTASHLVGLKLISPYNFEGQLNLRAYAVAHENDGDVQRSNPVTFAVCIGDIGVGLNIDLELGIGVGVGGVGLGVGVGVGAGLGVSLGSLYAAGGVVMMEDSSVRLSDAPNLISGLSAFVLGLLSYVKVTGIPNDFSLSAGTKFPDGSWHLTTAQLFNLYLIGGSNSDADFNMVFSAELLTLISLPLTTTHVTVVGVADVPTLSVLNATGNEDSTGIAIAVTSALTDIDGSETLSLVIKDLPAGFKLNVGIDNGNGTWTVAQSDIASLHIIPAAHFSGDVNYTIVAITTERDGDASAVSVTGHLHINPVADAPVISVISSRGAEDQPLALNLAIGPRDADGSEVITSVVISGMPAGAVLSHGIDNHNGSWTVAIGDVPSLNFIPPAHWHGDLNLSVQAVATELVGGSTASSSATIAVHIDARADVPLLSVVNETGAMDDPIALHINAALVDTDGSERLGIVLHGVPDGAVLSAGQHNDDGSWTLQASQLVGLTLTPPFGFSGEINLSATAYSVESSNGHTAQTSTVNFTIDVEAPMMMSFMMSVESDDNSSGAVAVFDSGNAPPPDAGNGDTYDHAFHG